MKSQPVIRDVVLSEIEAAFDGLPRGNGITLHQANAMDDRESPSDQLAARSLDVDKRWQDVSREWIEEMSSAFAFLDTIGLRYYLPAVIVWDLKHGHSSPSGTADLMETILLEWEGVQLPEALTARQNRAVATWLEFKAEQGASDAKTKLVASSWGKFLS